MMRDERICKVQQKKNNEGKKGTPRQDIRTNQQREIVYTPLGLEPLRLASGRIEQEGNERRQNRFGRNERWHCRSDIVRRITLSNARETVSSV